MSQINIPNYPSNSNASKQAGGVQVNQSGQTQPQRVVTPMSDMKPQMVKKSIGTMVKEATANPLVEKTRNTAIEKIIMPNLQRTLYNVVDLIVKAIIFKDQSPPPATYNPFVGSTTIVGGQTNYGGFFNNPQIQTVVPQAKAMTRNETLRVHDLIFPTEEQAVYVKTEMENSVQQYGHVTAAFVNVLTGRSNGIVTTANEYGWRDLSQAYIKPEANGFWLILPEAQKLA